MPMIDVYAAAGTFPDTAQLATDGSHVFMVSADGHARRWDFATASVGWTRSPSAARGRRR